MTIPPVDPSALAGVGAEWQVPSVASPAALAQGTEAVDGLDGPSSAGGESFGDALVQQISNLSDLQARAADASQALASGTAADASSVVIAVEKAQLAMQLAGQVRTRASEALSDIFHTQI